MVRNPSSLTLRTGPWSEAARAARVLAPSTARATLRVSGAIRRMAPKVRSRPSRSVTTAPSIPARASRTVGSISVSPRPLTTWWSDRLASLGERLSGSSGSSTATSSSIRSVGAISWGIDAAGSRRTTKRAPLRSSPRLSAAWKSLPARSMQVELPDGLAPGGELGRDVQEPPAGVAERERQAAVGEDLDLLRRGQDQADMPAVAGRPGVVAVGPRAGARRGRRPLGPVGPSGDVDGPAEVAVAVDDVDGPDAVAEPVEPLDRRQADAVLGRPLGVRSSRAGPGRRRSPAAGRRWRPGGSRRSRAPRPGAPPAPRGPGPARAGRGTRRR